jgi:biotin operon repressor
MKTEITLKQYLDSGHSQESLAKQLGVTQGAVQQMKASGRDIRLILGGKKIIAYEIRPIPAKRKQSA